MPETGVEDIVRGEGGGNYTGCGGMLAISLLFIVLILGFALLASYCGSSYQNPETNTNVNR